jgi:hypothetical protein
MPLGHRVTVRRIDLGSAAIVGRAALIRHAQRECSRILRVSSEPSRGLRRRVREKSIYRIVGLRLLALDPLLPLRRLNSFRATRLAIGLRFVEAEKLRLGSRHVALSLGEAVYVSSFIRGPVPSRGSLRRRLRFRDPGNNRVVLTIDDFAFRRGYLLASAGSFSRSGSGTPVSVLRSLTVRLGLDFKLGKLRGDVLYGIFDADEFALGITGLRCRLIVVGLWFERDHDCFVVSHL